MKCFKLLPDCVLIGSNQSPTSSYFYLLLPDGSTLGNEIIHPGQITDFEVLEIQGKIYVVSTCTDSVLRVFEVDKFNRNFVLTMTKQIDEVTWPTKVLDIGNNTLLCGLENGSFYAWNYESDKTRIITGYT